MSEVKKWTILIYADGNNEMIDVIYKNMLDCEKSGSNENVNVIMQIGLIDSNKAIGANTWIGVRRYYIRNPMSYLIEDLGKINMADPNNLYKFIEWGFKVEGILKDEIFKEGKYYDEIIMAVFSGEVL